MLQDAKDAKGRALRVLHLPLPPDVVISRQEATGIVHVDGTLARDEGEVMAASYVNFYIANRAIVMPLFDGETDAAAEAVLREAFPGREVTASNANACCI